ncbi:signal peptide peptidase SppA [Chthonobacter rhizosphaerae]|uniref:signal peptide peptidase SppA n=1 Tax=Chthonobacter rhizosphaerae TaxID=2735553 RepID=UPI0015EE6FB0|nr:signal peptide peptidase SppA [Chthonobacter rhizosphaerae]
MSLDADVVVDRRRAQRKIAFWRAAAFLVAALAVGVAGLMAWSGPRSGVPHIARITVSGVILADRDVLKMIEEIGESERVRGVVVAIDSPGGSTTGGEGLYTALRALADRKPTVATLGTLAASAGYMTAIAADHIVAQRTSITGSIGVLFQYGNVAGLLDSLGVTVRSVKSGPLKAEPSPFEAVETPGAREMIARMVDDTYQWFVDIVAERRKLDRAVALRLSDGSVYTGRQAMDLKLVDAIGSEDEAIDWLEKARGVPRDLPVVDWRPEREFDIAGFGGQALASAARALGLPASILPSVPPLDGLVSVWQPQLSDVQ